MLGVTLPQMKHSPNAVRTGPSRPHSGRSKRGTLEGKGWRAFQWSAATNANTNENENVSADENENENENLTGLAGQLSCRLVHPPAEVGTARPAHRPACRLASFLHTVFAMLPRPRGVGMQQRC